jgi:hypothetical protein
MTLQQTRLRLTQAIRFGHPPGGGGGGTVTSIAGGNGLTPGPIVGAGAIGLVGLTSDWNAGNKDINSRNSVDIFNVVAYGADPTGAADSIAAINLALAAAVAGNGGTVYFPRGTFKTSQITLTSTGNKVRICGEGSGATRLIPAAANQQLFAAAAGSLTRNWEIDHFSVMAHPAGSTGAAVNLEYMHSCHIHHIEYESNGAANFTDMFYLHTPVGFTCYNNRLSHIIVRSQSGPVKVAHCAAAAQVESANVNFIDHWLVEGNTGISRVFDAGDSFELSISDSLIEGNVGAVVLVPGQSTTMKGCYLESNGAVPILPEVGHVWDPWYVVLRDNFWWPLFTITMTASCAYWQLVNNNAAPTIVEAAVDPYKALVQSGQWITNGLFVENDSAVAMNVAATIAAPSALGVNPVTAGNFVLSSAISHNVGSVFGIALNGFSYDTYIQARHLTNVTLAYNLLLQPLGGNVGIKVLDPTRTLDLNGTQRWRGIAAPAVSEANSATVYFDSGANKLKASLNGSAYVDLIGSAGLTGSGVAGKLAYWSAASVLTDEPNITLGGTYTLDVTGDINTSAASVIRKSGVLIFSHDLALSALTAGGHSNPVSQFSTGIGASALDGATGIKNTALGFSAAGAVSTGAENTVLGYQALLGTNTGANNTAVGKEAGLTNTTGANNLFLGHTADAAAGNLTNAVAIGYQAVVAQNDSMQLGNAAMKVGIRAGGVPHTALDVGGQVSHRMGTVAVVNGLNSDIATPDSSFVRLTGPTGGFSVGGFTGGFDGNLLTIHNTVAFQMTVVNEDVSSTAINRIKTLTGGNVVLRAGTSSATFHYDTTDDRWVLTAQN